MPTPSPTAELTYRLNTLLHTMRAIARHEDQLCTLMHEVQNSGIVDPGLDEELRDLLEQMPSHEYQDDVEAVRTTLTPALVTTTRPKPKRPAKSPAKRSAKS